VLFNVGTGTWTVTATDGTDTDTTEVTITEAGQIETVTLAYAHIYGIMRDITSEDPAWTRTDDAIGFTATASVGTVAGSSDFDNCYPWSEMHRETLSTGDVMVYIPRFYYRRYREGNIECIKIADRKTAQRTADFELHPFFFHGNVESDYCYIAAYKTSSNNKSASGASPTVSQTRATMRTNAKAKGEGWSLVDASAVSAVQMLYLAEFGDNNSQAQIGSGYVYGNSAALKTGTCDNVPNLTGRPAGTDGKVDIVYRGIEGFWGNVWEWTDGVNWNGGTYYVCNTIANYADNTATNYTALSFTGDTSWSSNFITKEGLDTSNSHVILPAEVGSGSASTYECDGCWGSTGWRVFARGCMWTTASTGGILDARFDNASTDSHISFGSRLIYIPQEDAS
jgi:hypothetical protein